MGQSGRGGTEGRVRPREKWEHRARGKTVGKRREGGQRASEGLGFSEHRHSYGIRLGLTFFILFARRGDLGTMMRPGDLLGGVSAAATAPQYL